MQRKITRCPALLSVVSAAALALAISISAAATAAPRPVVIDQDSSGPGGSNMRSILALLNAPDVQVLGITVVTGNAWMAEESAHLRRMLELIGRRDVPVYDGAVQPLVRDETHTIAMQRFYGKIAWLGAWGQNTLDGSGKRHAPDVVPPLTEGAPTLAAHSMDAAHFLVQAVNAHPHEVTIWAAGPLTNLALAQRIDPDFARKARALVVMGSSLAPVTDDPEFATNPTHEFNFWFDPEAAHIVLTAPWPRITVTGVDISLKTWFGDDLLGRIKSSSSPVAQYLVKYDSERYYMWDEIAAVAWLDPSLITATRRLYLDVDLSQGPNYGNTLAWTPRVAPDVHGPLATVQMNLDVPRFYDAFVHLLRTTPAATLNPAIKPQER